MTEMPLDSPPEDVAEQRTDAYRDGSGAAPEPEVSLEADPADARDQADEVPLDEDEWR